MARQTPPPAQEFVATVEITRTWTRSPYEAVACATVPGPRW
ncbi:hypothetical protein ACH4VT_36315 [Streptomyces lydicus]